MGGKVERVPRRPRVVGAETPAADGFGRWIQQQRRLRGISLYFVAARTKLSPERVREIEEVPGQLTRDGHGRAIARTLARSIGADPDEAVRQLRRGDPAGRSPRPPRDWTRITRRGIQATLVLVVGAGLWLLADSFLTSDPTGDAPDVVYRPDYVQRLLGDDD